MRAIETSAKTRKEAIQRALDELGVELHEVDIDILDEGSKGFLGIGMRDVTVRVAAEHLPDEKTAEAPHSSGNSEAGSKQSSNRESRGQQRGGRGSNRDARGKQGGGNRESRGRQGGGGNHDTRNKQGGGGNRDARSNQGGGNQSERKQGERSKQGGGGNRDSRRKEGGGGNRDNRNKQGDNREDNRRKEGRGGGGNRDSRSRQGRGKQSGQRDSSNAPKTSSRENSAPREETPRRPRPPRKERTTPIDREAAEGVGKTAAALLQEVIGKMGMESSVASKVNDEGDIILDVSAEDSAILIGRKGRNLSAMQFLINRMALSGEESEPVERIIVDVEGYLERRRTSLEEMAVGLAKKAMDTGRTMRVKPLDPHDRRIIHLVLEDEEGVRTYSLGNSLHRRVVIVPQNGDGDGDQMDDKEYDEQDFDDQVDEVKASDDQAAEDQTNDVQANADQKSDNQADGDQVNEDQPEDNQTDADQADDNQTDEDQTDDDQSDDDSADAVGQEDGNSDREVS